ncbi:putative lipoprotein YerB precursor [compost metagenome]
MAQGSYFWRDNKRKAPHNLYTSSEKLLKYINDKKLSYTPNNSLVFSNEYWDNSVLDPLDRIVLKLNKYYSTSYVFKDGYYVKSMDGTEAIDTNTNQALKFTNIVIQKTNIVTREDGRLNIKLDGSGEAYVLSKGKIVKGTWRKDSSKTMLLDSNNTEIPLSKGNTIWHIISNDVTIPIE